MPYNNNAKQTPTSKVLLEYPYPPPSKPMQRQKKLQTQKTQLHQQTKVKTIHEKFSKSGGSKIQSNLHKMKESKKLLLLLPSSSAGGLNPEEESFMLGAITIGEVPNLAKTEAPQVE